MPRAHTHAPLSRRGLFGAAAVAGLVLAGCAAEPRASRDGDRAPRDEAVPEEPQPVARELLLVSLARSDEVAVIDPALPDAEAVHRIRAGAAPWGVAVASGGATAYAATAEGLAVIDLAAGERSALVAYRHPAPFVSSGEYRPGGLGLAVSPDGSRVYVAVWSGAGGAVLEVFDTAAGAFVGEAAVGERPFDVLVAPDGSWAATVDHDSFGVTVIDAVSLEPTTHRVAPFGSEGGLASWEKPHYGAVEADGSVLLPVQGRTVVRLDPRTGATSAIPSAANSHSHGTALAGRSLLTVGTGAFGNATGGPNLSVLDLDSGSERLVPTAVPHETVAPWKDPAGREYAAMAGGNTRDAGWDGITLVALDDLSTREIPVPGYPQAIVRFARS